MRNIKISVTQDAIAYARDHLWGDHPGKVRGMVQDQTTGESAALVRNPWDGEFYGGRNGQYLDALNKGTVEARIALARIGAQGGKAGKGTPKPGVAMANAARWDSRSAKQAKEQEAETKKAERAKMSVEDWDKTLTDLTTAAGNFAAINNSKGGES